MAHDHNVGIAHALVLRPPRPRISLECLEDGRRLPRNDDESHGHDQDQQQVSSRTLWVDAWSPQDLDGGVVESFVKRHTRRLVWQHRHVILNQLIEASRCEDEAEQAESQHGHFSRHILRPVSQKPKRSQNPEELRDADDTDDNTGVVIDAEHLIEDQVGHECDHVDESHQRVQKLKLVSADVKLENVVHGKESIHNALYHRKPIAIDAICLDNVKAAQDQREYRLHDVNPLQDLKSVEENQQPLSRCNDQRSAPGTPYPPHA
mmetsp:Transcript_23154/g.53577  ORF Transcript_23154/g.53577 Transcript_23154/m.53577 type:complete len:263 (-) Transcript_23154:190-978(-)